MALGALFYDNVTDAVTLVLLVAFVVIEIFAFVNCLTQRADAFPVVGSLSKPGWLAILGGSVLLTLAVPGLGQLSFNLWPRRDHGGRHLPARRAARPA